MATQQISRNVLTVIGTGGMGLAIARRLGSGRQLVLADYSKVRLEDALQVLRAEGYAAEGCEVDVSDRASVDRLAKKASSSGRIDAIVHTAGVSPVMGTAKQIFNIDLLGTAHVIDAFYPHISPGASLVCISSLAGHLAHLDPAFERHLALAPADQLLSHKDLDAVEQQDGGTAYQIAKRGNTVRVQANAVAWGLKGARINTVSPGLISTPMGAAELAGPSGKYIQGMIGTSAAKRIGTPDDVACAVAFLVGNESSFITGNDILVDGGEYVAATWGEEKLPDISTLSSK